MALWGPGQRRFPLANPAPAALGAERMGVEAGSFQDEGGLLQRALCRAPRRQGDGYKGLASGYNSGAVSHSAGQRAGRQSSLCLCLAGLGPAAPLPLLASHPCLWPFVWTPPHWLINPLLPATYLALWLGHAHQALVSISHAGEKQARLEAERRPARFHWHLLGRRRWHGSVTVALCAAGGRVFGWIRAPCVHGFLLKDLVSVGEYSPCEGCACLETMKKPNCEN